MNSSTLALTARVVPEMSDYIHHRGHAFAVSTNNGSQHCWEPLFVIKTRTLTRDESVASQDRQKTKQFEVQPHQGHHDSESGSPRVLGRDTVADTDCDRIKVHNEGHCGQANSEQANDEAEAASAHPPSVKDTGPHEDEVEDREEQVSDHPDEQESSELWCHPHFAGPVQEQRDHKDGDRSKDCLEDNTVVGGFVELGDPAQENP